jgi:cytochrome P450
VSSGLAWTLWCLAHHVDIQQKVMEEVDRVFGNSKRDCLAEDLKEMPYLEQCIKEAMRLYPPVPFFTRKPKQDFKCCKLNKLFCSKHFYFQ